MEISLKRQPRFGAAERLRFEVLLCRTCSCDRAHGVGRLVACGHSRLHAAAFVRTRTHHLRAPTTAEVRRAATPSHMRSLPPDEMLSQKDRRPASVCGHGVQASPSAAAGRLQMPAPVRGSASSRMSSARVWSSRNGRPPLACSRTPGPHRR